jgi:hypothetical protein
MLFVKKRSRNVKHKAKDGTGRDLGPGIGSKPRWGAVPSHYPKAIQERKEFTPEMRRKVIRAARMAVISSALTAPREDRRGCARAPRCVILESHIGGSPSYRKRPAGRSVKHRNQGEIRSNRN